MLGAMRQVPLHANGDCLDVSIWRLGRPNHAKDGRHALSPDCPDCPDAGDARRPNALPGVAPVAIE